MSPRLIAYVIVALLRRRAFLILALGVLLTVTAAWLHILPTGLLRLTDSEIVSKRTTPPATQIEPGALHFSPEAILR